MKHRIFSIALVVCLTFALAVPVCAAETDSSTLPNSVGGTTVGGIDNYGPENPIHPYSDKDTSIHPNWSSGINSTHQFITGNAINLIRNAVSSYPLASYTSALKTRSDWPDDSQKSQGENDNGLFLGHFYDPSTGKTYDNSSSPTAKTRLVNRYQLAVSQYKAGNKDTAMTHLAFALHYAADLSTPHHAANKTALNSNHTKYEKWVKDHQNNYVATSLSSSTLSLAKSTSIGDMGHNFAVNAKAQINNALNDSTFGVATQNALPKAQRNCAAVIYKFLVDVGAVR